jgi:hypothetical protein
MSNKSRYLPLHHDLAAILKDILRTRGADEFLDVAARVLEVTAAVVVLNVGREELEHMLFDMESLPAAIERRKRRRLN